MWFGKKAIIYITKSKIWITPVTGQLTETYEADWDGVNLTEVFIKIKTDLKITSARIILGADAGYSLTLTDLPADRATILEAAKTIIPEDLDDHSFDWKAQGNLVEIAAVSPFLLKAISYAGQQSKIRIDQILPVASLLARATTEQEDAHLIFWAGPQYVAVIANLGLPYFSQSFDKLTAKKVADLLALAKMQFNLQIDHIIHDLPAELLPQLDPLLKLQIQPLNPTKLLAQKRISRRAKDADILLITPITGEKPRKFGVIWIIVSLLVPLLLLAGGFFFVGLSRPAPPAPAPTPTPTATPTPVPVNLSDYSIQVLNGSGTPGEAGRVRDLLVGADFEEIAVGNAESYDYTDTQISLKPDTPDQIFETITQALKDKYTLVQADPLALDIEFSAIIIVGSRLQP